MKKTVIFDLDGTLANIDVRRDKSLKPNGKLDWEIFASKMRCPAWLFDTRSICNLSEAKKYGLNIWRVGADPDMIN